MKCFCKPTGFNTRLTIDTSESGAKAKAVSNSIRNSLGAIFLMGSTRDLVSPADNNNSCPIRRNCSISCASSNDLLVPFPTSDQSNTASKAIPTNKNSRLYILYLQFQGQFTI